MKSTPLNSSSIPPVAPAAPTRLLLPVAPAVPTDDAPQYERRQDRTTWPDLPSGISLTSRSLTFSTERFSLEYTHRSVEVDPLPAAPRSQPTEEPAKKREAQVKAPRSGAEARRRSHLADLLTSPHPSRRSLGPAEPASPPMSARPRAACRCYVATAQGSGRGDHCFSA